MSFDFFNTSNLAFGKKLAAAFKNLDGLTREAENNLEQLYQDLRIYKQYVNRNYPIPRPAKPDMGCRTNELYDLIDERLFIFNNVSFSSNKLNIDVIIYNTDTNRITHATGNTTIKNGTCYYKESTSNNNPDTTLVFGSENVFNGGQVDNSRGTVLFSYRVDELNNLNIQGDNSKLNVIPLDFTQYSSLAKGASITLPYTAKEPECVCIIGKMNNIQIKKNGKVICQGYGYDNKRYCITYLKKGDKVEGSYSSAFKINYITRK